MTVSAARAGVGGIAIDVLDRAGWQVLGTMPNHAYRSDGQLAPTTYFWKDLHGSDVPARDPS
jgi:hypothetical protein